MARKPVLVQLTDQLDTQLEKLSAEEGRSKSALVRDAVAEYTKRRSTELKEKQMAEAYARIPDDDEFAEWAEEGLKQMVEEEPW